jgi:hypothetical protein
MCELAEADSGCTKLLDASLKNENIFKERGDNNSIKKNGFGDYINGYLKKCSHIHI